MKYDALTQGSGEVNGYGALALAGSADTTRAAGSLLDVDAVAHRDRLRRRDRAVVRDAVWGTRLIRGSSLVDVNQGAWANNIVWGTGEMDNIVWGTFSRDDDNIVWGTLLGGDNIVWGTLFGGDNIVWGTLFGGNAQFADNIVWGTAMSWDDNIVWGTGLLGVFDGDNIVWGTMREGADNIVWGTLSDDNIVWGTSVNKVLSLGTTSGVGCDRDHDSDGGTRRCRCRSAAPVKTTDWRKALPVLQAGAVTLRELRLADAPSLLQMLTTAEVSRFISPPPTSVDGFERFIAWTHRERAAGRYICFGVVPQGFEHAIGIIQIRTLGAGLRHRRMGLRDRLRLLGHRHVPGGGETGPRLRVRRGRHPAAGSAFGGRQRPRQRRAAEDRRDPREAAAQVVPPRRRLSRPGDLVDLPGRLASVADAPDRYHSLIVVTSTLQPRPTSLYRLVGRFFESLNTPGPPAAHRTADPGRYVPAILARMLH